MKRVTMWDATQTDDETRHDVVFYPPRRRLPRCDVVTAIPQTGQGQRAQPTMKRVTKWAQLACHASHILTKLACHASHIFTRRLVSSMSR